MLLHHPYNFIFYQVGDKDKYQIALESFQAQCRTESMVTSDMG